MNKDLLKHTVVYVQSCLSIWMPDKTNVLDSDMLSMYDQADIQTPNANATESTFAANLKALPPPIPPEYWIPLYGIIISSIVGWSIPSIIGGISAKRQGRRVNQYYKQMNSLRMNSLYVDSELDIEHVDRLKTDVIYDYTKGKISDQHYSNLKNEMSILYEEIFKEKIDSLNGKFDTIGSDRVFLDKIKNEITDAYAKGKITDQHYNLSNEKISEYKNNLESINKLSSFQKTKSKTEGSPIKSNNS